MFHVGFSRPTNRKQLWRYLIKLSNESSSIQYNLYTTSTRRGLAEIISEVMRFGCRSGVSRNVVPSESDLQTIVRRTHRIRGTRCYVMLKVMPNKATPTCQTGPKFERRAIPVTLMSRVTSQPGVT